MPDGEVEAIHEQVPELRGREDHHSRFKGLGLLGFPLDGRLVPDGAERGTRLRVQGSGTSGLDRVSIIRRTPQEWLQRADSNPRYWLLIN